MQTIRNLYRQESGATAIEYTLIVAFIALTMLAGLYVLSNSVALRYNNMSTEVNKDR